MASLLVEGDIDNLSKLIHCEGRFLVVLMQDTYKEVLCDLHFQKVMKFYGMNYFKSRSKYIL